MTLETRKVAAAVSLLGLFLITAPTARAQCTPHEVATLAGTGIAAGDEFGVSLSVSGDTLLVGSWLDADAGLASGSAYVFQRDFGGPDNWGEVAKLTASDAAALDTFGVSVALSGDTALIGSRLDDDNGDTRAPRTCTSATTAGRTTGASCRG